MTCKETHASCLRYDADLGCLVYDNNLGESKPVKLPPPAFSAILNSQCELVIFANNEPMTQVDLTPLLAKIQGSEADLDFRPGPCQLIWTPPGGGETQTFDLSTILDKAQDGATYNQTTCVLTITNVNGDEESFSLANILGKSQDAINFNPTDCVLTYTNVNGDPAEVQLTALFNKMQFNGQTCELTVPVPGGVRVFDMSQVLAKISVSYDPTTHSLVVNNNGNVTSQVINCSSLELIQSGTTCLLRFTNAKGQTNDMALPGSTFTRDVDTCTITVGNGKGGGFTFREGLDPVADIQFSLTADKDLQLQVKDECMKVVLPDFVTDVTISDDNCELKIFKWCSEAQTIDIFAALGLTKNADGGFDVRLKDQICTFSPATLSVNPANPNEFIFNNQFGQTTVITVPTVALDMDGATLNGSVLQLTFGGDGNPGSLNVDICAVVAQNCNATLTVNLDGSLTHVDNAGTVTNVPAPPAATADSNVSDNGDGTATITQSDSTVKDDVVCGQQSTVVDNADDAFKTMTQNDGTSACIVEDPVIGCEAVENGIQLNKAKSDPECFSANIQCRRAATGRFDVGPGVTGPLADSLVCVNAPTVKCGSFIDTRFSWSVRDAGGGAAPDPGENVVFDPELSQDGGALWILYSTGGTDSYYTQGPGVGRSETSFDEDRCTEDRIPYGFGDVTICARLSIRTNNLVTGNIQLETNNLQTITVGMRHC